MYKNKQIQQIFAAELKDLVKDKIIEGVKDAGQSITPEEALYLVSRITQVLKDNFKSLTWGDVCLAFRNASQGKYGKIYKLTVNSFQYWVSEFLKEKQNNNREQFGRNNRFSTDNFIDTPEKRAFSEFMSWLTSKPRVYVSDLFKDYDVSKKEVPEGLYDLQKEYQEAKAMEMLPALKRRLLNIGKDTATEKPKI